MSALFAATYPERTAGARPDGHLRAAVWAPDYPWGPSDEERRRRLAVLDEDDWGGATRDWLAQSWRRTSWRPGGVRWFATYIRRGASPGAEWRSGG